MDAGKVTSEVIRQNGGKAFITTRQTMKILGIGRDRAAELLGPLDYHVEGRTKKAKMYFVRDVVDAYLK